MYAHIDGHGTPGGLFAQASRTHSFESFCFLFFVCPYVEPRKEFSGCQHEFSTKVRLKTQVHSDGASGYVNPGRPVLLFFCMFEKSS